MRIDADFVAKVLPQSIVQTFPVDANFSVDTRTLQKGDIFIALCGQKVDGHDFIDQALKKGASAIIANESERLNLIEKYKKEFETVSIIFVPDSMQALIDLAYAWRSNFFYPVVAITGSAGKTTTKEIVRNILQQTNKNFIVSSGNQNTLIGISLNVLKMRAQHHVAVFEVGIAEKGSMKKLVQLLRPTYSAITMVGHGHMQGLGTLADVAREKREVFSTLRQSSVGIINGDQKELNDVSYPHPVIRFGKKTLNQIQARKIVIKDNCMSFLIKIYQKKYFVALQGCNQARINNALCAIAIGKVLQIPDEQLIAGILQPVNVQGRFEILPHASGSVLINDGYNANPESVKASLEAFGLYKTGLKKVLVLGDMMELGEQSNFWHRQIGRMIKVVSNIDSVVFIGKHVEWSKKTIPIGVKSIKFDSVEDAFEHIKSMLLQKDKVFLFKASNSLRFSQLVKNLQEV